MNYRLIKCNMSKAFSTNIPTTYHKRTLPQNLIALSSTEGKTIFKEALLLGSMECFFPLSEQFVTQSDPSFCSLSTLAMVLNALNHDPKKIWKGVWRWVTEETLQCDSMRICGHSLAKVKTDGMNFREFESVARCHGARILSFPVDEHLHHTACDRTVAAFRNHVDKSCSNSNADAFVVSNFSRKVLGQTGDGHFSPIGGYHPHRDLVLIMDVARFKYPPFWVPLELMWEAMLAKDKVTLHSRGYYIISTWKSNEAMKRLDGSNNTSISTDGCPPLIRTWKDAGPPQIGMIRNKCCHMSNGECAHS